MRNWILVLGSLLVLVGCGGDSGGTAGGDGAAIYRSNCALCHGADGQGGTRSPSLVVSVPGSSESELTDVVTDGIRAMPEFGSSLTRDEIDAVVQFLLNEWG